MTLFSIVIPTYNSSNTICNCIYSIINQSFSNFEIIIVDNFSTDETLNLVKQYQDERIKIYVQNDQGIYDAMNIGIQKVVGQWILFLGSDDNLYDKDVLENVSKEIGHNIEMLYGNVMIRGACEKGGWFEDGKLYGGEFSAQRLFHFNISHQAIFYNKSVFLKYGYYDIRYNVCADWNLNLKIFCSGKVKYIDQIISLYQVGGYSASAKDECFIKDKWYNIAKYYYKNLFKHNFSSNIKSILLQMNRFKKEKQYNLYIYLLLVKVWYKIRY